MNHGAQPRPAQDQETEAALRAHFGHDAFRPGQREIVRAVLAGESLLALMPTGAGKSLCYQLPALMDGGGVTLVVSPLIALMKDQVDALTGRGIAATFINSQLSAEERRRRLERVRAGELALVYVAPERFRDPGFLGGLRGVRINRMAVDEAHCISQWGHDFRPDYRALPAAARALGIGQICAFTATATPEVRRDITSSLELQGPRLFAHGFSRDNLILRVVQVPRMALKIEHLLGLARHHDGGGGIVYAATRKHVDAVSERLRRLGLAVGSYHAGLDEEARSAAQRRFMTGQTRIMVATNAFGMGIDKPDIRFVAHYDVPGSLEAYYQEAGRAGRDGASADCVILFNYADVRVHEFFIEQIGAEPRERTDGRPPPDPAQLDQLRRLEQAKLKRMVRYCYADECRHGLILGYFGARREPSLCGRCDCCLAQMTDQGAAPPWLDASAAAGAASAGAGGGAGAAPVALADEALPDEDQIVLVQKILSAYARARGRLTASKVAALLRGTGKQLPADLAQSRSCGLLADTPARSILAVIEELRARGALRRQGRERVYLLTALGGQLMRREQVIPLRLPLAPGGGSGARRRRVERAATGGLEEGDELDLELDAPGEYDEGLYQALRAWRIERARRDRVPAYVVAHDRTLKLIAAARPDTPERLLAVKGIGPGRLETFGAELIDVVRGHGA